MKYLIHCGTGIGDVALILPMVKMIRENDNDAYIKVFNNTGKERYFKTLELCKLQNLINSTGYYNAKEIISSLKFLHETMNERFDYAFDIEYIYIDNKCISRWPYIIERLSAKKVIGFRDKHNARGIRYDFQVERDEHEHIVESTLDMLKKIGMKTCSFGESLFDAGLISNCWNMSELLRRFTPKKFVALVIGAGNVSTVDKGAGKVKKGEGTIIYKNTGKQWPFSNFISLANKLSSANCSVVLVGGAFEHNEIESYPLNENVYDFTGKLSVSESVALINSAMVCVGGDTGLMHCAGMCNIKTVALFGCTGSDLYRPYGAGCHIVEARLSCAPCIGTKRIALCNTPKCMSEISVDKVFEKIMEAISED